ncbi:hypothetical protein D3C83_102850 [compost metagenome]
MVPGGGLKTFRGGFSPARAVNAAAAASFYGNAAKRREIAVRRLTTWEKTTIMLGFVRRGARAAKGGRL